MYETNKNKRRFYEGFNGSTSFYAPKITSDSAQLLNGTRRRVVVDYKVRVLLAI